MSLHELDAPLVPSSTAHQLPLAEAGHPLDTGLHTPDLGPPVLVAGQVIGKYTLRSLLGRGGMGSVWKVWHASLRCERALKLIYLDPARRADISRRLDLERWSLGKLSHDHIVVAHDAGVEGMFGLIETELLLGVSLDRLPGLGLPKPPLWSIEAALQICGALEAAHELGIVHRDLKPSNVMLVGGRPDREPSLKLLDFGLTKWLDDDTPAGLRTRLGEFLGTPSYASPEQARGEAIDHRSDLYSLGVMLYELLTGRRPFGGSPFALLWAHSETPPASPSALGLDLALPDGLEELVLRCLSKRPADRPGSAGELADEMATIRNEMIG